MSAEHAILDALHMLAERFEHHRDRHQALEAELAAWITAKESIMSNIDNLITKVGILITDRAALVTRAETAEAALAKAEATAATAISQVDAAIAAETGPTTTTDPASGAAPIAADPTGGTAIHADPAVTASAA